MAPRMTTYIARAKEIDAIRTGDGHPATCASSTRHAPRVFDTTCPARATRRAPRAFPTRRGARCLERGAPHAINRSFVMTDGIRQHGKSTMQEGGAGTRNRRAPQTAPAVHRAISFSVQFCAVNFMSLIFAAAGLVSWRSGGGVPTNQVVKITPPVTRLRRKTFVR